MARTRFQLAHELAFFLPVALMAGALLSQYWGGLFPCEMCHWQRWPHYTAIGLAGFAFFLPPPARRLLVVLAALAIATSGAIGVFHAGVEYHWWNGITACASNITGSGGTPQDMLARIMGAPIIRCDVAQWSLFGISLAGFNALFSLGGAATILWLMVQDRRR
ncbi:disulfide bond formation protein B [Sphingomonas sp.]|jgi:disulfide bond formation protein DsbB|uniref:disulfide bond formation protein B n=1 Tax=Sphingomonas sp. TaxID=28214 RepID=UPI003D6CF92F